MCLLLINICLYMFVKQILIAFFVMLKKDFKPKMNSCVLLKRLRFPLGVMQQPAAETEKASLRSRHLFIRTALCDLALVLRLAEAN